MDVMLSADQCIAITAPSPLWTTRNRENIYGFGLGTAHIWEQEHAADGA